MSKQQSILAIIMWLISLLVYFPVMLLADETPLDESTPPTEVPTASAKYSGPPAISFYLSDEDYLLVKVDGLLLKDVDGFTFAGTDISELIGQYEEQGIVDITEKEDGFLMEVKLPIQQLAGENEFGLLYSDGNKLSAIIDSEKLLADATKEGGDRGFGYTNVYGTLTKTGGCCYCGRCSTQYASYATVDIYTWNGNWVYRGSTTATASGYFDVYLQGYDSPYILVRASSNGMSNYAVLTGPACSCTRASVRVNMKLQ